MMKRIATMFLSLSLVLNLSACGAASGNQPSTVADSRSQMEISPEIDRVEAESAFPFSLTTKDGAEVTFTHVPETILCTNANAGDQLMALGLGDKIIGTGYNNTKVAEEFREEYESKPVIFETYPSLETILEMEPDFVYGRSSSFSEKNHTEHDTLSKYGIMSLSSIEGYKVGADLEDVYQDFYNLGRIFQIEDKADEVVNAMKEQVSAVQEAVAGKEPVKVFVFDMAQEEGAYTCGNNFTSKLIEHAGGMNIFKDMETTWGTVSWEKVVELAPEVIVINDYGKTSLEEKIAQLKDNPALATIPAIQNDRIIPVTLCESFASSMTGGTVEKFARAFHPDCF